MRRIRYQVACSLDGFIAGAQGEHDWIVMDPDIDFGALFAEFDTLFMGRRTFEGLTGDFPGMRMFVFSRTMRQADHPEFTIISDHFEERIDEIRGCPGKDIWLFGGGELFRSLLEVGRVDTIEPAIVPILLGNGRPLLPATAARRNLELTGSRLYEKSGIMLLEYTILPQAS